MFAAHQITWFEGHQVGGQGGARTKETHPYNYDPFTTWLGSETPDGSAYTDHLFTWGPAKHDRLCEKHFGNAGQHWANREPEAIEAFLRDYLEAPRLVLCEIQEQCNQSSGFPCWFFSYRKNKEAA